MSRSGELDPVFVRRLRQPQPPKRTRILPGPRLGSPTRTQKRALYVVAGAVALCVAIRLCQFALHPVVRIVQTGDQIRNLEVAIAREKSYNADVRSDVEYLKTSAGIEQEARRKGWVRPGEIAISVVQPAVESGPTAGPPGSRPTAVSHSPTFSDRIRSVVETCLAVLGQPHRTR
ncbi:MAG: hypothetical protein FJX77_16905 [Armatimonadetes bacterium]|nr:hypothetical protein [Armatimonadota bacterium]